MLFLFIVFIAGLSSFVTSVVFLYLGLNPDILIYGLYQHAYAGFLVSLLMFGMCYLYFKIGCVGLKFALGFINALRIC